MVIPSIFPAERTAAFFTVKGESGATQAAKASASSGMLHFPSCRPRAVSRDAMASKSEPPPSRRPAPVFAWR